MQQRIDAYLSKNRENVRKTLFDGKDVKVQGSDFDYQGNKITWTVTDTSLTEQEAHRYGMRLLTELFGRQEDFFREAELQAMFQVNVAGRGGETPPQATAALPLVDCGCMSYPVDCGWYVCPPTFPCAPAPASHRARRCGGLFRR